MRRPAIALLLSMPAACGLAFAPGDYREPGESAPDASSSAPVDGSSSGTIIEGGPIANEAGVTSTRIALFAGRRDALTGETGAQIAIAETMLTSIDTVGTLGAFTFDAPPPSSTAWLRGGLVGGEIFLQTNNAYVHAPITDHVGAWSTGTLPPPPQPGVKPFIVDPHGALSGRSQASGNSNAQAWSVTFTDAGQGSWQNLAAKTTIDRGNVTIVRAGANVYLVGGETAQKVVIGPSGTEQTPAQNAHSEVEVAKLDANGQPGDFHTTSSLPPNGDGGAFATFEPIAIASADHLFLLGGLATTGPTSLTDVGYAAKIKDATTGDLDAWAPLPKLPQAMTSFAAVVTPSWLVVFGGQVPASTGGTGKTTDAVLRLAIHADGTFGTSWETAGKLPGGGRAAIVGATY